MIFIVFPLLVGVAIAAVYMISLKIGPKSAALLVSLVVFTLSSGILLGCMYHVLSCAAGRIGPLCCAEDWLPLRAYPAEGVSAGAVVDRQPATDGDEPTASPFCSSGRA